MNITTDIVKQVIDTESIHTLFQPIVSVSTRRIIGLEALSRGRYDNEIVSPFHLFSYGKTLGMTVELEKICREKALNTFSSQDEYSMLFLNFETDIFDKVEPNSGLLHKTAKSYNLTNRNIVIEINEKGLNNNDNLKTFVDYYRAKGYLIALDDVGAGHSNLNRISLVRPDIVKIDRAIIQDIDKSLYSQEIFKSIVELSKKIGAFTIAEGTETVEEVITCMMCGVDFFQGYFFSKPLGIYDICMEEIFQKLDETSYALKTIVKQKNNLLNLQKGKYIKCIDQVIQLLSDTNFENYEDVMLDFVVSHPDIECIFLLNDKGIQITDTIITKQNLSESRSELFSPAVAGDKHEMKNYFYAVNEDIEDPFISDWYISSATGNPCKTISSKFITDLGEAVIVCVDMKHHEKR